MIVLASLLDSIFLLHGVSMASALMKILGAATTMVLEVLAPLMLLV